MEKWLEVIDTYAGEFGPIFRMAHDGRLAVEDGEGQMYVSPQDETVEKFVNRMNRSKKLNRNLFLNEYKKVEYDPDLIY